MFRATRIVPAALGGAAIAALLVGVLASGAGSNSTALVTLQVAARGPGSVPASPASVNDKDPCTAQQGENDCEWRYERGTTVKLTAKTDAGSGKSFSGWSNPDCGNDSSCTVKVDDDLTSLVATFSPLMLGVVFSNNNASGAKASFDPAGQPCANKPGDADFCREYPAHTRVRVTVIPGSKQFSEWNENPNGAECLPRNSTTCTISVDDQPTWAGGRFAGENAPQLATTIKVEFQVRKAGNGSGRGTASKLDCGNACSANFGFGKVITLTAKADEGSLFDGWNGVCARTDPSCTLALGPITFIKASFARDTTAPSVPGGLTVKSTSRTSIAIGWSASTDNVGVSGYRVYVNGSAAGDTKGTEYSFEGLKCGRSYEISVDAVDANGNRSQRASIKADTQLCALAARLAGVGVRSAPGKRTVFAKVRVNRATTASLRLTCSGRAVASGRYRVKPGTNELRLGVPRRQPAGPCRLAVSLVNPDGGTLGLGSRGVLLPKPR